MARHERRAAIKLEILAARQRSRGRECGGCTACCFALAIPEVPTAQLERCQHQCDGVGCAIYAERPQPCSGYKCGWLGGLPWLGNEDRPDKTGVVIDFPRDVHSGLVLIAHAAFPGALTTPKAQAFIARLVSDGIAVVIVWDPKRRTLSAPPGHKALAFLNQLTSGAAL